MIDEELVDSNDESTHEDESQEGLVPYAPDFTPATLGKKLGEDRVLPWLLENARGLKGVFLSKIAESCLSHIPQEEDRRDMASHVVQGLQNYLLVSVDESNVVSLSADGEEILNAATDRDELFARHILTRCNGFKLVEAIQRFDFRHERPTLEKLTDELDRSATSKNISTMRAWLSRAGVLSEKGRYSVDSVRVRELIGQGAPKLLGLSKEQVEFLLAARVLVLQEGNEKLDAPDVKLLAETRAPDIQIPAKALGKFVAQLISAGLLGGAEKTRAKGGTRTAFRLGALGFELSDEQVRGLVKQSGAGLLLSELLSLDQLLDELDQGNQEQLGRLGEMLAVHACLMLGLRVIGWRNRHPVEIDLTAERTVGLAYQRWHIQVKNTKGHLDADRVDREIGAAAGTGATHLLFVVPRAALTSTAAAEIHVKSKLTHLHIYRLTRQSLGRPVQVAKMIRELRGQEAHLVRLKQVEAERRERQD